MDKNGRYEQSEYDINKRNSRKRRIHQLQYQRTKDGINQSEEEVGYDIKWK